MAFVRHFDETLVFSRLPVEVVFNFAGLYIVLKCEEGGNLESHNLLGLEINKNGFNIQ
jgi:hypothetical protein